MKTISVVIADDQALIRSGLRNMLHGEPHLFLAGEAKDGAQLLTLVVEEPPDVLLLDLRMPEVDGMQVIRTLERQGCPTSIVVISQYMTGRLVQELRDAGVLGFLDKDAVKGEVVKAVEEAYHGRFYASEGIRALLAVPGDGTGAAGPEVKLTEREQDVLQLLCKGKTNKEIAAALFLSPRTVEKHRLKLYEKLKVSNARGVLLYALENGYYTP